MADRQSDQTTPQETSKISHHAHSSSMDRTQVPEEPQSSASSNPDEAPAPSKDVQEKPNNDEEEAGGRSTGKIALIMFSLCMAVFLAALDITIITTALPTIAEVFDSPAGYTWVGSAFLLAQASATPVWSKFSDIFGRKPVILLANFIFFVGSLICALSINIGMLITGRAIQGIGAGGLLTLSSIVIGDLFSPRKRGGYYGMIGAVWAVASSLGPIIGGAFTENVTWRWCFYINLPLDGLAFIIILFFLDIKTPKTPLGAGFKSIDWLGAFFVVAGTLLFLFGMQYGGETFPWGSATVVCLLVFGILTWVGFFVWEAYGAKYPIIPTRIFRIRSNLASLGVCFCHAFVFIAGSYYLPLYFQTVLGKSPILSGVYTLATTGALAVTSISTGIFIRVTGNYMAPIWFGFVLMILGYGLFIDFTADSSIYKIVFYQIVGGLGTGTLFQAPLIALQSGINPRDIAAATASFTFTRNIASSISIVIGQVVFSNQMLQREGQLIAAVGAQQARAIGTSIGANTELVQSLPPNQRSVVDMLFAENLQTLWIVYTCIAALGFLCSFLIGKNTLSKSHKETETGLEAQEAARKERLEEERLKKEKRRSANVGKQGGNNV